MLRDTIEIEEYLQLVYYINRIVIIGAGIEILPDYSSTQDL
jgi:hypothetical protein